MIIIVYMCGVANSIYIRASALNGLAVEMVYNRKPKYSYKYKSRADYFILI